MEKKYNFYVGQKKISSACVLAQNNYVKGKGSCSSTQGRANGNEARRLMKMQLFRIFFFFFCLC